MGFCGEQVHLCFALTVSKNLIESRRCTILFELTSPRNFGCEGFF
jgi:hypothetical protein